MKIVDLKLNIDGMLLEDSETVEDYISKIQKQTNSNYDIVYEILHCEVIQ